MTRSPARAVVVLVATITILLVVAPTAAGASPAAPRASQPAPPPAQARYRTDRVLVKFKPGMNAQRRAQALRDAKTQAISQATDVQSVSVPNGDVMGEVNRLKHDPSVEYAQPDYIFHATGVAPDDPGFASQWSLNKIDAPDAWTVSEGSSTPVVAVIDSGVDYNHPDLAGNMWNNPTGFDGCAANTTHGYNALADDPFAGGNPSSPYYGADRCDPLDDDGHGTHVAGTIGAVGNNGQGVAGVNWHVQIMAVKFLDSSGSGSDDDAIAAINWVIRAKQAGVNVRAINASWGSPNDPNVHDAAIEQAVQSANDSGILFVAAAGNDASNNDSQIDDPCDARKALCVAATDSNDQLASFSNYGRTSVALAAPGVGILSTWCDESSGATHCDIADYAFLNGTSMATPHVTGAAALVSQVNPSLTPDQIRQRLVSSVDAVPGLVGKVSSGGRLNLCRALAQNGCAAPVVKATQNGSGVSFQIEPVGGVTQYHVTPTQPAGSQTTEGTSPFTPSGTFGVNQPYVFTVAAINPNGDGPAATVRVTPLTGGYLLDGLGGLHPVAGNGGSAPPAANGAPYWGTWNIARGVAALPSGAGGYVLDGYGGLHPFGVGSQAPPQAARVSGYWPGWDIARGVAFLPDGTGGYVVDGYGGLHPFAVGNAPMPPNLSTSNYWPGWDIVRGIATVPSGTLSLTSAGGLVLDGFGGIHGFTLGGATPNPSNGPYWKPWDIARGITVSHDGSGGYVGDGWGGAHPFRLTQLAPSIQTGQYWQGWDISRGLAL